MALSDLSGQGIQGLAELQKVLDELPRKLEVNVLRGGMRAGARVIAEQARANAPVDTGKLRASMRVSSKKTRNGGVAGVAKMGGRGAWYAPMVEFGARPHDIPVGDGEAQKIWAHPGAPKSGFLRRALDSEQQRARDEAAAYMRQRLASEMAKRGMPAPEFTDED